jgi:hypothetical protein
MISPVSKYCITAQVLTWIPLVCVRLCSFLSSAYLRLSQFPSHFPKQFCSIFMERLGFFFCENGETRFVWVPRKFSFFITCRYCSSGDNLTIDHVIPISRGGKWEWDNLVCGSSASILSSHFVYTGFSEFVNLWWICRWLPVQDATPGRVRRHWSRQTWSCARSPGWVMWHFLTESWLLQQG